MFGKSLSRELVDILPNTLAQARTRLLFKLASKLWKSKLTAAERASYSNQAACRQVSQSDNVEVALNEERQALKDRRVQIDEKTVAKGCQGLARDFKLSDEAQATLQREFESPDPSNFQLQELRTKQCTPAKYPSFEDRTLLLAEPCYSDPRDKLRDAWWLPFLCRLREHLASCAIRFGSDESDRMFLFLFAKQSPFQVSLIEMKWPPKPDLPWDQGFAALRDMSSIFYKSDYALIETDTYTHEYDLSAFKHADVFVDPHVVVCGRQVSSDFDFISLESFLETHPEIAKAKLEPEKDELDVNPPVELVDQCPWLEEHENSKLNPQKKGSIIPRER